MFKTKQRSTIIRSLAAAAGALAIAAVGAGPASAWQVDHPRLPGACIDFGSNWDAALGEPLDGGTLRWNTAGGVVTPTLRQAVHE